MPFIKGILFHRWTYLLPIYFLLSGQSIFADDSLAYFEKFKTNTLSTQHFFSIPFTLNKEAREVRLDIYSPDNEIVCSITEKKLFKAGSHVIHWDGKDSRKLPVPNEAYTPVLTFIFVDQTKQTNDPRDKQQPAFFSPSNIQLIDNRHVSYTLEKPARVQVRAGIENGPMIHEIESWTPQDSGKYIAEWDGFDNDKVVSLIDHPNLILSVSAYTLHDHIILVNRKNSLNYQDYYKKNHIEWMQKTNPTTDTAPTIIPPALNSKIKLHVSIEGKQPFTPSDTLIIKKPTVLHVALAPQDTWMVNNGKFEVGFFVDYVFSSEAEQYFLPIAWILYPDQFSSGEHILSININGPYGSVATQHLKFSIP